MRWFYGCPYLALNISSWLCVLNPVNHIAGMRKRLCCKGQWCLVHTSPNSWWANSIWYDVEMCWLIKLLSKIKTLKSNQLRFFQVQFSIAYPIAYSLGKNQDMKFFPQRNLPRQSLSSLHGWQVRRIFMTLYRDSPHACTSRFDKNTLEKKCLLSQKPSVVWDGVKVGVEWNRQE